MVPCEPGGRLHTIVQIVEKVPQVEGYKFESML
jgi:hypothetical protein